MAASRKQVADALKQAAAYLFFKYRFSCHFEVGVMPWGRRRVDVIGNKISGQIVIVEVKSSLADLRTDNKMHEYRPFCDRMYLCVTKKVYEKAQTAKLLTQRRLGDCGVLVLDDTGYCRIRTKARSRPMDLEVRVTILARLAWRSGDLSKRTRRARKRIYIKD